MSLADLTLPAMGQGLRARDFSARDLLDAHLARIAARDHLTRAFWDVTEDRAREAAEAADAALARGEDRGALMGLPFAVKDTMGLSGRPTTCGSAAVSQVAERDAEAVARLVAQGAVPLGKVATYDLGTVGPSFDLPRPPARNPWDPARITGGSSSGSAAAVAGGLVRLALGSDTAGSIRAPASYCGRVGLKPTGGPVPTAGVFSLAPTLDTVGPLAATVAEAALGLDALLGTATDVSGGGRGMRVGYARDWAMDPGAHPGLLPMLDEAVGVLSLLGARVAEVSLPDYALLEAAGALIIHVEGLGLHRAAMREDRPHGREAYKSLAAGVVLDEGDRRTALRLAPRLRAGMDAALEGNDVIVTATTLTPALPFAAFEGGAVWTPMRTLPFNVTGHPALSLPMGFADGLPMGLQVVGRHGAEAAVLRIAAAFEGATDHAAQRPG